MPGAPGPAGAGATPGTPGAPGHPESSGPAGSPGPVPALVPAPSPSRRAAEQQGAGPQGLGRAGDGRRAGVRRPSTGRRGRPRTRGAHAGAVPERGFLAKAAAVTAGLTAAGALLGLVRDQTLAGYFGAGAETDAFLVAWTVPEFASTLLVEDAMALIMVPAFARALAHRSGTGLADPVRALVRGTLPRLVLALGLAAALLVAAAPLLVRVLAPGLPDPALAIDCTRLTGTCVLTFALVGYCSAALRAHGRFLPPALIYVAYNVGIIGTVLLLRDPWGVRSAAAGVAVGGLLMVLVQAPSLLRELRAHPRSGRNPAAPVRRDGEGRGPRPPAYRGGEGRTQEPLVHRPGEEQPPAPAPYPRTGHRTPEPPPYPRTAEHRTSEPPPYPRTAEHRTPEPPPYRPSGHHAPEPPPYRRYRRAERPAPGSSSYRGGETRVLVLGLIAPVVAFSLCRQSQTLIERFLASPLPAGAISHLNYAQKVAQLPMAFSLMLCTVSFPTVARALAAGDAEAARRRVERDLLLAAVVVLVGASTVIATAPRIVELLFERGEFGRPDTLATGAVMRVYALGLLGQTMVGALVRCYFSAARPLWYPAAAMGAGLAVTTVAGVPGAHAWGAVGIAAANALGITVTAVMLLRGAHRQTVPVRSDRLGERLLRLSAAGALATGAGWLCSLAAGPALLAVAVAGLVSVAVFAVCAVFAVRGSRAARVGPAPEVPSLPRSASRRRTPHARHRAAPHAAEAAPVGGDVPLDRGHR
ncbi:MULTISPECIES: murein biosynthesis integral membrane protein MurJ [unclassified Streptomyces]|uniref:murein biosynthesis integral membrane protein MurJ n=1 Tax=unclassified Streptomyces TaxID=2593676 RepID=UPI001CB7041C|nr:MULTISPECIES: lipid II flippase MurJ [unclassified Streptomyces]